MMKWATLAALLLSTSAIAQQIFVNGLPLEASAEEQAAKAGRKYVFATGNNGAPANLGIPTPAGSYLNVRICNNGSKPYYIGGTPNPPGRFLDSTNTAQAPYGGVANPDALTTAQAATLTGCGAIAPNTCNLTYGSNLLPGGPAQTDISMSFGVGSLMTVGGAPAVPTGTGIIYPGDKNDISQPRALPAGRCFGQYLGGAAASLTTSVQLGFRVYIYSDY